MNSPEEEEIEIYSTPTESQQKLNLDTKGSGFEDVMDENGDIHTQLNEKVIIRRIAKDLYKGAKSGLRELLMNSYRGCEDGVELFGHKDPHITITLNEAERLVIIEDNGRGITKARFKKVLRVLGDSDNFDGTKTGQFGMGFASYLTLSSVVTIDTRCDNGDNYQMIYRDCYTSKYAGLSNLESHGCKLTLTCYPEVSFSELSDVLYEITRFGSIPTTVIIEDFEDTPEDFDIGTNEVEQTKFDSDADNFETEGKHNVIRIETEDFALTAIFGTGTGHRANVSLLNVPIDSKINCPFYWWVINIKDERKFLPMPDRDRMREESDKALQLLVDKEIKKYFATIDIKNYNDYMNFDRKEEFIWLIGNPIWATQDSQPLLGNLNQCVFRRVDYTIKKDFSNHHLTWWLHEGGDAGIIYQGFKNETHTEKVMPFLRAKCIVLTAHKANRNPWDKYLDTIETFGVPQVKQVLKDNKVKIPKKKREAGAAYLEIKGHTNRDAYDVNDLKLEDIDENCIRVDDRSMTAMMNLVKEFRTKYTFLRNTPALKTTPCMSMSEWVPTLAKSEVMTSKGSMTIEALLKLKDKITYCPDYEPEFLHIIQEDEGTIILENDRAIEVALVKMSQGTQVNGKYDLFEVKYVSHFVKKKYNTNMNSNIVMKFFVMHKAEVPSGYMELFATSIQKAYSDTSQEDEETAMMECLEKIKNLEGEVEDDVISKLKYFSDKLTEDEDDAILKDVIKKLRDTIEEDDELRIRLITEHVIPAYFGDAKVRKVKLVNYKYSYHYYTVVFATKSKTLKFDDLSVLGWSAYITDPKINLFKRYSVITVELRLSD